MRLRLSQEAEAEVGDGYLFVFHFQVDLKVLESQGARSPTIFILCCPCDDGLTEEFVFIAVVCLIWVGN